MDILRDFLDSHQQLIEAIRLAIMDYNANSSNGGEQPLWNTPTPWKTKVLKKLEEDHQKIELDIKQGSYIKKWARKYVSLSKDLDNFSLEWAAKKHQDQIGQYIKEIVLLSDKAMRWPLF